MALPQNNTLRDTVSRREIQQYQELTMKEVVKTATKAGLFTAVSNTIAKSPILSRVPYMGKVAEAAEIKKRELYFKQGRDESGRKLTRQELEDRELRRKDAGAVGSIFELMSQDWKEGVPVIIKGAMGSGGIPTEFGRSTNQVIPISDDITPYETEEQQSARQMAEQEQQIEQERADDADQDRAAERQESFFKNLYQTVFGDPRDRNREQGGLLGLLSTVFGPIMRLMKGGITGLLTGIIGPLFGVIASAVTGFAAMIVPLLPIILAGLAAAGVGMWVSSLIDDHTAEMEKKGKLSAGRGISRRFAYTDPKTGEVSYLTAQEMGTTEEDIKSGAFKKEGLDTTVMSMETEEGKLTGRLAMGMNSDEAIAAFRKSKGGALSEVAMKETSDKSMSSQAIEGLKNLDTEMANYTDYFFSNQDAGMFMDPGVQNKIVDGWNTIRKNAETVFNSLNEQEKTEFVKTLGAIADQYDPFKGLVYNDKITQNKAKQGAIAPLIPSKGTAVTKFLGYQLGDDVRFIGSDAKKRSTPFIPTESQAKNLGLIQAKEPSGSSVPNAAQENANLKLPSPPAAAPPSNSQVSNVSNTANVMSAVSARQGGIHTWQAFNQVTMAT